MDKADILNKRGIFSSASNMTRLRTQLGIDVNEIVDVNSLKRHVVDQIKEVGAWNDMTFEIPFRRRKTKKVFLLVF